MTIHLHSHWTPMTDTTELPRAHRGLPVENIETHELWLLDLRPSVPTRYERPDHLRHFRDSARAAFWPLAIGCGVILALLIIAHLQGVSPVSSAGIR